MMYMQVVWTERDGRRVPHLSHSHQQLQRRVTSWSGDSETTQGRRQ